MPLYFAYGSNMDLDAMALRCPRSRALGPARLARHRLALMREGYLSVAVDPRREVWGMLWELSLADVPALARYEEVSAGLYAKRHHPVIASVGAKRALVYVGRNAGHGGARPGYLEAVLAAAGTIGLPGHHLAAIERMLIHPPGIPGSRPSREPVAANVRAVRPTRRSPLEPAGGSGGSDWTWQP